MKHLFQKINKFKVLILFFQYPNKTYYLRELAKELHMNPATTLRYMESWVIEMVVSKEKKSNGTFYKLEKNNKTKALKLLYTLWKFEMAKVVETVQAKSTGLTSILLYGSAAQGEDNENSEYDILAIANNSSITPAELAEKLGREVNLKVFSIARWKETSQKNRAYYLEVIANSICLYGSKPILD